MAKKRLNVKFVALIAAGVVLLAALVVAYVNRVRILKGSPDKYVAQARELMAQGKYREAGKNLYDALTIKGEPDPELYVMLGDAWMHLAAEEPQENIRKGRGAWEQAVAVDPRYLPALQRIFQNELALSRMFPQARAFDNVRDAAKKLLAVDPADKEARKAIHTMVIMRWRTGVQVDPREVDEAIEGLTTLLKEDPGNSDAAYYIAFSKLARAEEARNARDEAAAQVLFADGIKMIEDALAAQPNSAEMHFRACMIYQILSSPQRKLDEAERLKFEKRMREELEQARQLVKVDDPIYLDVMREQAMLLLTDKKSEEATEVLRQLMKDKPDEQLVRLELARQLVRDPKTQAEAIALLQQPVVFKGNPSGFDVYKLENAKLVTQLELLKIRLDSLPADRAQRAEQLKELDKSYDELAAKFARADDPNLLSIRGRIEMARDDNVAAVQTLTRAARTMESMNEEKLRVMLMLAQANLKTGQSGEAQKLLQQVLAVPAASTHTPARTLLIGLLLDQKNFEAAKAEIEILRKQMPEGSPVITTFVMRTLDREKDKDQIRKLFDTLPETTIPERYDKARAAIAIMEDYGQGIRLLESVQAERPDDIELIGSIASLYNKKGQREKALQLVKGALAKKPDNIPLQALERELADATPEQMREFKRSVGETLTDPFLKELYLAELARDEENVDDAIEHLTAAEKIKQNDPRVNEMMLQMLLAKKEWDKAQVYLDKLAAADIDRAGGLHYRIAYLAARGDIAGALEKAQQLTKDRPEFAGSWLALARVQQAQGSFSDAVTNFQFALERQPTNLDAIRGMIESSLAVGRLDDAQRFIERAQRLAPNNVSFREMGFRYELVYGDPDKVIGPRQELLKANPDDPRNWYSLTQTYMVAGRKKNISGDEAAAKDRFAKARETVLQAQKKWPDDPRLVQLLSDASLATKNYAEGEQAIRALMAKPVFAGKPGPALLLVEYLTACNKPAEAEKVLREVIATNPMPELQNRLSELLVQQNKIDDALALLSIDSPDEQVRARRILVELQARRYDEAQKDIDASVARSGKTLAMLNFQALVYERTGKLPEALAALDQVLAVDPRNANALLLRGRVRMRRGDIVGALPDLAAARDAMPENMQVRTSIADAYRARGDLDAATRELETALRVAPNDSSIRVTLLDLYSRSQPPRWTQADQLFREVHESPRLSKDPALLHAEAQMWAQRNDLNKAFQCASEALKLSPNDTAVARTLFEVMTRAKQYQQMLAASEKLAQARPDLWWLFMQRGVARVRMGDKEGGLAEFERGLKSTTELHDDSSGAQIVKAIADEVGVGPAMARVIPRAEKDNRWKIFAALLSQLEGDLAGSIRWCEAVVAAPNVSPAERAIALRMLGAIYAQKNPPEVMKAVEAYRKLLESEPNSQDVLNNLANVMIMPGSPSSPEDALKYSTRAYEMMRQSGQGVDPAILDTQGAILVLTGDVDQGISLLREALDRRIFPDAYYHLGDAYLRQSKLDEAEQALKSAQELITQAERNKEAVDPTLKSKIEEALAKVPQLRQQKSAGAVEPGK